MCCWRTITILAGVMAAASATGMEQTGAAGSRPETEGSARGEPVAVVKEVGDPQGVDIRFMDYLYKHQRLDLGKNTKLTIVYLANCRAETLTGGNVVIGEKKSRVTNGRMTHETTACSQAETVTTAKARRAGATVVRDSERFEPSGSDKAVAAQSRQARSKGYDSNEQGESDTHTRWRIHGLRPLFKWQEQGMKPPFKIEVMSLSGKPPRLLWYATTDDSSARYPEDAPALALEEPYRVRVTGTDKESVSAIFLSEQRESSSDDKLAELVPLAR